MSFANLAHKRATSKNETETTPAKVDSSEVQISFRTHGALARLFQVAAADEARSQKEILSELVWEYVQKRARQGRLFVPADTIETVGKILAQNAG